MMVFVPVEVQHIVLVRLWMILLTIFPPGTEIVVAWSKFLFSTCHRSGQVISAKEQAIRTAKTEMVNIEH
jgi:hypothetical protein